MILGAGWAAHLIGCGEALLNFTLKESDIPILGVAFEDLSDSSNAEEKKRHNEAAKLSISEVPGTQAIFYDIGSKNRGREDIFFGEAGFYEACWVAIHRELPKRKLKEPPPTEQFTLNQALEELEKSA